MTWARRPAAALAAAAVLLAAPPAAAQEPEADPAGEAQSAPETLPAPDVEVLDVFFPEELARALPERGAWLPVYVELRARGGRSLKLDLEGTVVAGARTLFHVVKEVEVGPGAPLRVWLYLRAGGGEEGDTAALRIASKEGRALLERSWSLGWYQPQDALSILIVGEALGDVTPWPGQLVIDSARRGRRASVDMRAVAPSVESMPARKLPDGVLGYDAVGIIVLRDLGDAGLEEAQAAALRAWVYLGGLLVVVPRRGSEAAFRARFIGELAGGTLLPEVDVDETFAPGDLAVWPAEGFDPAGAAAADRFVVYARREEVAPGDGRSYRRLDPLSADLAGPPLRREIDSFGGPGDSAEGTRLYAELRYGDGALGLFTIDDQAHRDEKSMAFLQALWRPIVAGRLVSRESSFRARASRALAPELAAELRDPSRDIGLPFLIGLIITYLLLAGPGLYWFLKRRDRLHAILWAEPLLAAVYVGVVLLTGQLIKGVITKTNLVVLISQEEGEALAVRESYLTVFAGAEDVYGITAPRGDFLSPVFARPEDAAGKVRQAGVRAGAGGLSLSGLELGQWQQGYAQNGEVVDLGGPGVEIAAVAADTGAAEQGRTRLTNNLPFPIRAALLYDEGGEVLVPRLEPGAQAIVARGAGAPPGEAGRREREAAGLTEEVVRKTRKLLDTGLGRRGRVRLLALLDRGAEDFRLDRPSTVKERKDYYILVSPGEGSR